MYLAVIVVTSAISAVLFSEAVGAIVHAKREGDPDAGTAMVAYPIFTALLVGLLVYSWIFVWHEDPSKYDRGTLYSTVALFMVANVVIICRFHPRQRY